MVLEYRLDLTKNIEEAPQVFLVKEATEHPNAYKWVDLKQRNTYAEYGHGNSLFLFSAAGRCKQPYALDLIHADSLEEAEAIVHIQYDKRINRGTLIPETPLVMSVMQ